MRNTKGPIQVLLYNPENDEVPDIVTRLPEEYNVSVRGVSGAKELRSIDRRASVLLPYCCQDDNLTQVSRGTPEGVPILGLADDKQVADSMIENGFYDYFILKDEVTESDMKALYNRLKTLERSFSRDVESVESVDVGELAEFAPDAFMVVNEDMSVRYMNKYSKVLENVDTDLETKEDILATIHPDDQEKIESDFNYLLNNPREVVKTEYRVKCEDGEWMWLESSSQNLIGYKSIDGIFSIIRDITERKEKEKEIRRHRDRLDEVISIMSHDLRNLLNVGMARSEMLHEEYDDDNARAVNESLERMAELISDSLDIAETGKKVQEFDNVNLDRLVKSCGNNTLPETVDFRCEDQIVVKADKSRLSNLLENLFNNSVEHNDTDVTIRVGKIENQEGFFVEDTGDGIDDDKRDKVFNSGFSCGSGSGLGLNIVKQVSEAHEWDLELLESEEGGARFEFTDVEVIEVV